MHKATLFHVLVVASIDSGRDDVTLVHGLNISPPTLTSGDNILLDDKVVTG